MWNIWKVTKIYCIVNLTSCFKGCDATHYGAGCSLECSVNCIQKTCNNITGSCTQGCNKGFYGDFCNNVCSGCLGRCQRDTGECEGACRVGTYGLHCEIKCILDCESGCNKTSGICTLCVDGKFGQSCNQTCSTGCASGCDRHSGKCVCKPGRINIDRLINFVSLRWIGAVLEKYMMAWLYRYDYEIEQINTAYLSFIFPAQQLSDPITNYQPYFHGVVVVMCTSFVLNIVFITW